MQLLCGSPTGNQIILVIFIFIVIFLAIVFVPGIFILKLLFKHSSKQKKWVVMLIWLMVVTLFTYFQILGRR
ncbi:hypothetical protein CLV59_105404 [Chitinophaga dinghuensis]|uniref:Uncharacterized protein n=1 Tax=Chitinophaga dinghuensis TaxID=1539050 RepID=A0A327VZF2_9BACT|nr:hypothetical protein CLV59_105404 [Chitinophaga dinghuensis]